MILSVDLDWIRNAKQSISLFKLLFYNFLLEICNSVYENKVIIDETENIAKYTKIYD